MYGLNQIVWKQLKHYNKNKFKGAQEAINVQSNESLYMLYPLVLISTLLLLCFGEPTQWRDFTREKEQEEPVKREERVKEKKGARKRGCRG